MTSLDEITANEVLADPENEPRKSGNETRDCRSGPYRRCIQRKFFLRPDNFINRVVLQETRAGSKCCSAPSSLPLQLFLARGIPARNDLEVNRPETVASPPSALPNMVAVPVCLPEDDEPTWQVPLCGGQFSTSFNVDGRLTCTRERSDGAVNRAYDYTLLFRNGTLEGVTSSLIPERMDELYPTPIAREICRTIRKWIPGLQFRDLNGPYFIALSLLGFEGVRRPSEAFSGLRSPWPIPDHVGITSGRPLV